MIYFFYNFYKVVKIYYTKVLKKVLLCCILNLLEMPKFRRRLSTQSVFAEIKDLGGLLMTLELVIATVTCVATVTSTVIALLSFLKKKDKE